MKISEMGQKNRQNGVKKRRNGAKNRTVNMREMGQKKAEKKWAK